MPRGGYACSSALRAPGQLRLRRPRLSAHQSTPRVASADRPPGRRLWPAHAPTLDVDTGAESARCPPGCAPTHACGCAKRAARWRSATRSSASSTTWSRATVRHSVENRRGCSTKRRPVLVSAAIGPTLCGLCGHATSRPVWLARVDQPADGRAEAGRSVGQPDARFGTERGRRGPTAEPTCFRHRLAGRLHALHARRVVSISCQYPGRGRKGAYP